MERILVSSCLLGQPVRYDGTGKRRDGRLFSLWRAEGRLVPCCPEVAGGLPVPRPPAEITDGLGGRAVLDGQARVLTSDGTDVTRYFVDGARRALNVARSYDIRVAILKEGSPSCGSGRVYDGTFGGRSIAGTGVTTALLSRHGIAVFGEDEAEAVEAFLRDLEAVPGSESTREDLGTDPQRPDRQRLTEVNRWRDP